VRFTYDRFSIATSTRNGERERERESVEFYKTASSSNCVRFSVAIFDRYLSSLITKRLLIIVYINLTDLISERNDRSYISQSICR